MKTLLLFSILSFFVFGQINDKELQKNLISKVTYLSSKELGGRLAGSEGFNKAAKYGERIFKNSHLKPMINGSYYQKFNIEYNEINSASLNITLASGEKINGNLGKDFSCRGFTGRGDIKAEVVFCGYGTKSFKDNYDDYKGADVKGKIVLIFKTNPKWGDEWLYSLPREKANYAFEKGAIGVILVSTPNEIDPQKPIGSTINGKGEQIDIPQIHIDIPIADKMLKNTGTDLLKLQKKIDSLKETTIVETKSVAEIKIIAKYEKEKETMNVVGMLVGFDRKLKDEYIIIGGHLDHVGKQGDVLYPGANDNASGASSVLQIAEEFAKNNIHPKRTIIFILFSCEEQGLNGSEYFVNHLPVPAEKIKAMMNFDCVAHGDSIQIGGGKTSEKLWQMIKKIDEQNDKMMIENTWPGGGADAEAFYKKGIPTAYFVTKNSYQYLHVPEDKVSTLNPVLYTDLVKLGYNTLLKLSNEEKLDIKEVK